MFHTYVTSILSRCCVCFRNSFKCFQVFLQVFQMHVSSFSSALRRMLQVLHLNVSKVDRVLHLLAFSRLASVSPPPPAPARHPPPPPSLLDVGDFRGGVGPWARETARKNDCRHRHSDRRLDTSKPLLIKRDMIKV